MARSKKPQFESPAPRQETTLLGHYEVAGQFCQNYDARDPYLASSPEREDLEYVSAERRRLRAKYR